MKYLCDACQRLVDVDAYTFREDALALRCPQCGALSVAAGSVELAEEEPRTAGSAQAPIVQLVDARLRAEAAATAGMPRCPKCGALRDEEREDCPRCGLVYALFRPELFEMPEPLERMWKDLSLSWDEPAAHERFLAACTAAQLLPEATRRYRLRAEEHPDDALACRFRDEAVSRLMALTSMPARPEPEPAKKFGLLHVLLILMSLAAVGVAFWQFLPPASIPLEAPFP